MGGGRGPPDVGRGQAATRLTSHRPDRTGATDVRHAVPPAEPLATCVSGAVRRARELMVTARVGWSGCRVRARPDSVWESAARLRRTRRHRARGSPPYGQSLGGQYRSRRKHLHCELRRPPDKALGGGVRPATRTGASVSDDRALGRLAGAQPGGCMETVSARSSRGCPRRQGSGVPVALAVVRRPRHEDRGLIPRVSSCAGTRRLSGRWDRPPLSRAALHSRHRCHAVERLTSLTR